MAAQNDGKQLVNTLYHAAIESILAVGYSEITKKILKKPAPKVDFNIEDIGMLAVDITLAMYTKDMLVKKGIIPDNIMK